MIPVPQLLAQAALLTRLAAPAPSPYPFTVGETLRYEAKLGYFSVGVASVSVARMVKERGADAFEFTASGEGGPPGWRVAYDLTSHVGAAEFIHSGSTAAWCKPARWTSTGTSLFPTRPGIGRRGFRASGWRQPSRSMSWPSSTSSGPLRSRSARATASTLFQDRIQSDTGAGHRSGGCCDGRWQQRDLSGGRGDIAGSDDAGLVHR